MHTINPDDRNLYAPLRRDDDIQQSLHRGVWPLLPGERPTFPACCGNCNQGRRPCVTPQACRLADDDDADKRIPGAGAFVVPAVIGVALFAALVIVHLWRSA